MKLIKTLIKWLSGEKPTKTWVGNVDALWARRDDAGNERLDQFFFHLYRLSDGTRMYVMSGSTYHYDAVTRHRVYSRVVKPWIDCGDDLLLEGYMSDVNKDYWTAKGYDVQSVHPRQEAAPYTPPAAKGKAGKPEFKVLSFERPKEVLDEEGEVLQPMEPDK